MGLYHSLRDLWKDKSQIEPLMKQRLIKWRKEPATIRIERPTRLDRARSLGYKAKEGYLTIRVKLKRGGRKREQPLKHGRRSKRSTSRKIVKKSYQWIAEERSVKKYPNCEVLNSYYVAQDGKNYWFEVILVDRVQVSKYQGMEWLANTKGRVQRGLTSAGKKSRGLSHKGKGAEKLRPSLRAHQRRGK